MTDLDPALQQILTTGVECIRGANTQQSLELQRVAWLGRKSQLHALSQQASGLSGDEKAAFWKQFNIVKAHFEAELAARKEALAAAPHSAAEETFSAPAVASIEPLEAANPAEKVIDEALEEKLLREKMEEEARLKGKRTTRVREPKKAKPL